MTRANLRPSSRQCRFPPIESCQRRAGRRACRKVAMSQQQNNANFIWSIADLLRGPYKPHQYGSVVLPFTILRRLDAVLEPTKAAVLEEAKKRGDAPSAAVFLTKAAGQS